MRNETNNKYKKYSNKYINASILLVIITLICIIVYVLSHYSIEDLNEDSKFKKIQLLSKKYLPLNLQIKTSNCTFRDKLPDPECTPGSVMTTDSSIICYTPTSQRRNVSTQEKRTVYTAYNLSYPQLKGAYEADHLIPLELGGSNDSANIWPEPAEPRPGFHEKDLIENYLHQHVCRGDMPVEDAQRLIAHDWYSVYAIVAE